VEISPLDLSLAAFPVGAVTRTVFGMLAEGAEDASL
jgi:sarcosine oxidase gamma subunit